MKMLVALLLFLAISNAVEHIGGIDGQCKYRRSLEPRPHTVSILEFGAVGEGKTLNTLAFQNAIFYLNSFAEKGGAQLYVPAGRWLTGSFNLTSHLTLFLDKNAVILGSQDYSNWETVESLPSYGRGIELPGRRYRSLITGDSLTDVVITGDNGTIDGQGSIWWEHFNSHSLNYSRPHLVEFVNSDDVIISNLTLLNSPAWNIHPAYCSGVQIQNITAHAPPESPYTSGIIPDSSQFVCIENCNISMGYDAISLKSGWDEYGIAYGRPTTDVHIRGVHLRSALGSGIAFGSEMSGGISDVLAEKLHLHDSFAGIGLRTSRGRGGYIKDVLLSDVEMRSVRVAIEATDLTREQSCKHHEYTSSKLQKDWSSPTRTASSSCSSVCLGLAGAFLHSIQLWALKCFVKPPFFLSSQTSCFFRLHSIFSPTNHPYPIPFFFLQRKKKLCFNGQLRYVLLEMAGRVSLWKIKESIPT